jgi:hypothetical protein
MYTNWPNILDGTCSGSHPMVGFCISSVGSSHSVTIVLAR